MSDKSVYLQQTNKLIIRYGKRFFPPETHALIWEELKSLSNANMIELIDGIIADNKYAPTRKDIREAVQAKYGKDIKGQAANEAEHIAHHNECILEDAEIKQIKAHAINKFGEKTVGQYLHEYVKKFMPMTKYNPYEPEIFHKRALYALKDHRGDMTAAIKGIDEILGVKR